MKAYVVYCYSMPNEPQWFDVNVSRLDLLCDEELTVQNGGQVATMEENMNGNCIQGVPLIS